jgi:uncharacterized protein involved in exopolysaccharide biosynthesis
MNKETYESFDSSSFIGFVFQWRKTFFIIAVAAAFLSTIFSSEYFITPLFKSEVILFPTSTNSVSKALLSDNPSTKDILEFGEDEQVEQMLQILNSNKIRDSIVLKFNLAEHYGIDPGSKYKQTRLFKQYESNIRFKRTENSGVKILVFDKDAQMAADIANEIATMYDVVKNDMKRKRAIRAYEIVEKEYQKLKNEIAAKEDSLTILRNLGVHDYESQSEMINRQLAMEIAKGNEQNIKRLESRLAVLAKYGGPYVSLRDALEHDKKQLSEIRAKYEEARVDAEQDLPQKFIVSAAYKAERKSYPIRWLIIVMSTMGALFLSLLIIIVFEQIDQIQLKKKVFSKTRLSSINILNNLRRKTEKNLSKKESTSFDGLIRINKIIMESNFNNLNIINVVLRWRVHMIVILIIAFLGSVLFSSALFITPKFKSWAVVYPANISPYSEESETEQMYQILQASYIRDYVIEKFKLDEHYEISKDYKYYSSALMNEYRENVKISKTTGEALRIEVLDKDPLIAKQMVDAILDAYNQKVRQLHEIKFGEVVSMWERALDRKKEVIDSLNRQLAKLAKEDGLIEFNAQSLEVTKGILGTVEGGSTRINSKEVDRLRNNMIAKGGLLKLTIESIENEAINLRELSKEYDIAYSNYDRQFTYTNIIETPYVADKKSFPVRWLIVVLTMFTTFFLALVFIGIIENIRLRKAN